MVSIRSESSSSWDILTKLAWKITNSLKTVTFNLFYKKLKMRRDEETLLYCTCPKPHCLATLGWRKTLENASLGDNAGAIRDWGSTDTEPEYLPVSMCACAAVSPLVHDNQDWCLSESEL